MRGSTVITPSSKPRVVLAIDRSQSASQRARAIGFARLQARLVSRHVLADRLNESERVAAWQALLDAEAGAGSPLPSAWRDWRTGAPALLAEIKIATSDMETTA